MKTGPLYCFVIYLCVRRVPVTMSENKAGLGRTQAAGEGTIGKEHPVSSSDTQPSGEKEAVDQVRMAVWERLVCISLDTQPSGERKKL